MTTWAGWVGEFIKDAGVPDTAENRRFLTDWAAHAQSPSCANNPIDLTYRAPGATDCAKFPGTSGRAYQAYPSHNTASVSFSTQLFQDSYSYIQAALESGHPYTFDNAAGVPNQLIHWGSTNFAGFYVDASGLTGGTVKAAHAHGGWNDLRRSVNHKMPAALRDSRRGLRGALRTLHRARKVRL